MKEKKYRYSEIFFSLQGEGQYSGIPTSWARLWGCNFTCQGFSQENINDRSTWVDNWSKIDLTDITEMKQLPVVDRGCDSRYSWDSRFRHLAPLVTAKEIANEITATMVSKHNPLGLFRHPSGGEIHMAFTGGEPLMSQHTMVAVMGEFAKQGNTPAFVTVETNGTQAIKGGLAEIIELHKMTDEYGGLVDDSRGRTEWFWSVSPKLSASGERAVDAIKPEVVAEYARYSNHGQLKYVVDGSDQGWDEVEQATAAYRAAGVEWPIWIMAVGATLEQQEDIQMIVAEQCMERGYNFSARQHCAIFGNQIGT